MSNPPFPLIRHVSALATPALLRLPVTANQVTTLSLAAGMYANWLVTRGTWRADLVAGLFMVLCYVLDNCDGEVARRKNQCSEFGARFDSFVDWIVHAAFFAALGIGQARATGEDLWLWLGWAGAIGGTLNYVIGLWMEFRTGDQIPQAPEEGYRPTRIGEWVIFFLRELSRADFCFIVLALAAADLLWLLVPAGAIGAQVYWMTQFLDVARRFHV
ncbi:MAG: CDP-alcohol phosphatidyltransferase family protein [Hyphomicrobiales bacterium]|nr:CDP-alcohol phosphatidyltransferase family protein [Hyphomicrobiales bacterium]